MKNIAASLMFVLYVVGYGQVIPGKSVPAYILKDTVFKIEMPSDTSQFKKLWHNYPVRQWNTGTCWCFGAVSMAESEIYRQTGKKIKLSEMYIVYWEYVEKAKRFVREKGNSAFTEASEANAVPKIMKQYGIVPAELYPGTLNIPVFYDHAEMLSEMTAYLSKVKKRNFRNERAVTLKIQAILDKYMGHPPQFVTVDDSKYTPYEYLRTILKFEPGNYFSFMSTATLPYNEKGELEEEDNWWHDKNYYNIRPDDFLKIIISALDQGYTLTVCGDVTEPGRWDSMQVYVVPHFDIPPENINEAARQYRMDNKSTTDDHCIHFTGYFRNSSGMWFLIKDSGGGTYRAKYKGYSFMHENYVKLKMMTILVNKNAARFILDKIIK